MAYHQGWGEYWTYEYDYWKISTPVVLKYNVFSMFMFIISGKMITGVVLAPSLPTSFRCKNICKFSVDLLQILYMQIIIIIAKDVGQHYELPMEKKVPWNGAVSMRSRTDFWETLSICITLRHNQGAPADMHANALGILIICRFPLA